MAEMIKIDELKFDEKGLIPAVVVDAVTKKVLTVAELKELSNEKVVEILSARHSLTQRQCELVKELLEEVGV